jgi:hypothetical protein
MACQTLTHAPQLPAGIALEETMRRANVGTYRAQLHHGLVHTPWDKEGGRLVMGNQ